MVRPSARAENVSAMRCLSTGSARSSTSSIEGASQSLMLAVRARALLDGRLAPSIDDVLDLAEPVLKHRMALTFSARAEGRTIPDVIRQLKTRIG